VPENVGDHGIVIHAIGFHGGQRSCDASHPDILMGAQSITGGVDRLEDGAQNWTLNEQQRFQAGIVLLGAPNEARAIATLKLVRTDQEVGIRCLQPLKTFFFSRGGSNELPKVLKPAHPAGH
jgi:hypothetical protein